MIASPQSGRARCRGKRKHMTVEQVARRFALACEGERSEWNLVPLAPEINLTPELSSFLDKGELSSEKPYRVREDELNILLQALLILSEGPCLLLHPTNDNEAPFLKRQADLLRSQTSKETGTSQATLLYTRLADNTDLVLLPIPTAAGGDKAPFDSVLLGFHVPAEAVWHVKHVIDNMRLPVVLDIDETLVVAHTYNGLKKRLDSAMNRRRGARHELQLAIDDEQRSERQQAFDAAVREEAAWKLDFERLKQFMSSDCVDINGKTYSARWEEIDEATGAQRPVIRHPEFVLTRIESHDIGTSMIIRLRPGWEELRMELMGVDPKRNIYTKQKFDVSVCTTAQRPYALEVWRLFDPEGVLIPKDQLESRIVDVKHSEFGPPPKHITAACRIGQPTSASRSPLPMAAIADDRTDVWDECSRTQVVPVEAYSPYKRAAEIEELTIHQRQDPRSVPWLSLIPLKERLLNLRLRYSIDIRFLLGPRMSSQHDVAARKLSWPRVRTIAELLKEEDQSVPLAPSVQNVFPTKPDIVIDVPAWETPDPPTPPPLPKLLPFTPEKAFAPPPPPGSPLQDPRQQPSEFLPQDPRQRPSQPPPGIRQPQPPPGIPPPKPPPGIPPPQPPPGNPPSQPPPEPPQQPPVQHPTDTFLAPFGVAGGIGILPPGLDLIPGLGVPGNGTESTVRQRSPELDTFAASQAEELLETGGRNKRAKVSHFPARTWPEDSLGDVRMEDTNGRVEDEPEPEPEPERPESRGRERYSSRRERPDSGKDRDRSNSSRERPDRGRERPDSSRSRDRPDSARSRDRPDSSRGRADSSRERPGSSRERLDSSRERYDSRSKERYDGGRGRFDNSRGRFDSNRGRGRFDGGRGRFDNGRGRFDSGRGRFDTGRGRFQGGRGRFDGSQEREYTPEPQHRRGRRGGRGGRHSEDFNGRSASYGRDATPPPNHIIPPSGEPIILAAGRPPQRPRPPPGDPPVDRDEDRRGRHNNDDGRGFDGSQGGYDPAFRGGRGYRGRGRDGGGRGGGADFRGRGYRGRNFQGRGGYRGRGRQGGNDGPGGRNRYPADQ